MSTEAFDFLTSEVTQSDIVLFADERVNLKRDYAQKYRDQVSNLREHLERYIEEHPEIGLAKMLLSGSLAKGTALSTMNDADVAVYVKGEGVPGELDDLLGWLVERLRKTFHQIPANKIYIDGPCIVISFSGTGINVEVAPILYEGDPKWKGYLWDRSTRKKVLTSIPLHLDFIRTRKDKQPQHFAQVIRILKWWVQQRKKDTNGFTMRSFLVELLMAKLADAGTKFDDYHTGLEQFFLYIQKTGLKERICFKDNYPASSLPSKNTGVVEIFDPVNPQNNVAETFTDSSRKQLVDLAEQALDTLSYARNAQTKGDSVACWQELMGSSFNA
jgi:tRNA nucleotidyltransferase (CCA-adding enzyme)